MRFFLISGLIAAGVVGRTLMVGLPNIEPVMLVTILAGIKYGCRAGAATGFLTMAISDFYIMLPGPWTLFTAPSFALCGFMAGFFGKIKKRFEFAKLAAALTVLYDFLTNIAFALMFSLPILPTLAAGVPFSIIHIVGNVFMAAVFAPWASALLDAAPRFFSQVQGQPVPEVENGNKEKMLA